MIWQWDPTLPDPTFTHAHTPPLVSVSIIWVNSVVNIFFFQKGNWNYLGKEKNKSFSTVLSRPKNYSWIKPSTWKKYINMYKTRQNSGAETREIAQPQADRRRCPPKRDCRSLTWRDGSIILFSWLESLNLLWVSYSKGCLDRHRRYYKGNLSLDFTCRK